jgi:hypothetical protein
MLDLYDGHEVTKSDLINEISNSMIVVDILRDDDWQDTVTVNFKLKNDLVGEFAGEDVEKWGEIARKSEHVSVTVNKATRDKLMRFSGVTSLEHDVDDDAATERFGKIFDRIGELSYDGHVGRAKKVGTVDKRDGGEK